MFWKKSSKYHWAIEYYDTTYKIYDTNNNLLAYVYPNYPRPPENSNEYDFIDGLNHSHASVNGVRVLLPLIKLNLLDIEEGINLEDVINRLEHNILQSKRWLEWFLSNSERYHIRGYRVFTAREDREMLSILINLVLRVRLDKNEITELLKPLLDELSGEGLI
jgi:hypothetical protein